MLPLSLIVLLMSYGTDAPLPDADSIRIVDARTVEVMADGCEDACFTGVPSTSTRSIDELMQFGNVALISRAAMAGEPVIRGLRGGQLSMTIDGMKVHSACVDKMDPINAYIELNNLGSMELNAGQSDLRYGSNLGGAMAFRMRQPLQGSSSSMNADVSYDMNSTLRQLRGRYETGIGEAALLATYTYRAANDYQAGQGVTVPISNFEKHNASLSVLVPLAPSHTLTASSIVDVAPFIGYPGLLMDTRDARGYIAAMTWKGAWSSATTTSVKVYGSVVDHTMDDLSRPVEEIMSRPFMPGMYMPMYGRSTTFGLLAEGSMVVDGGLLSATLDLSHLSAHADMDMLPLDSTVSDMHMTNIGDAAIGTYGLSLAWERMFGEAWIMRLTGRADVSPRTLNDAASRDILMAYQPASTLDRTLMAGSVSAGLTYVISDALQASLTMSSLERLPTHLESYGFWLYDPQSNFVTIGQPSLASERSWGSELKCDWTTSALQLRGSFFGQVINRFIATMPYAPGEGTGMDTATQVRTYANVGNAVLAGAEASFNYSIFSWCVLGGMASYTYGQAVDVNDALPMIAPITGMFRVILGEKHANLELRVRGASAQQRNSVILQPEDATSGWVTFDAVGTWSIMEHITLVASAANLANVLYHEHMSINNVPAKGRSLMVTVRTQW